MNPWCFHSDLIAVVITNLCTPVIHQQFNSQAKDGRSCTCDHNSPTRMPHRNPHLPSTVDNRKAGHSTHPHTRGRQTLTPAAAAAAAAGAWLHLSCARRCAPILSAWAHGGGRGWGWGGRVGVDGCWGEMKWQPGMLLAPAAVTLGEPVFVRR